MSQARLFFRLNVSKSGVSAVEAACELGSGYAGVELIVSSLDLGVEFGGVIDSSVRPAKCAGRVIGVPVSSSFE